VKAFCNKKCKKNIMEKRASEGGFNLAKTSDYGKVYMDQRKETLEVMMGRVQ
jgi:hypothetical protein